MGFGGVMAACRPKGSYSLPSLKDLGLVAAWDLTADGNDAHGVNHLTSNNSPVFTANGVDLEADDVDSLSIADNAAVSIGAGNAMFLCAFVNLESKPANDNFIVSKWGASGNRDYLLYRINSSDRFAFIATANGSTVSLISATTFGAPSLATNYFVYGWWNPATSVLGVGVNLVENTMSHSTGVFNGTEALYIGGGPSGASMAFDGLIKYPRLFKPTQAGLDYLLTGGGKERLYNGGAGLPYSAMN
jgi:hypothetical protein